MREKIKTDVEHPGVSCLLSSLGRQIQSTELAFNTWSSSYFLEQNDFLECHALTK